jgi:TM2 domain-containing membrane protein YozV
MHAAAHASPDYHYQPMSASSPVSCSPAPTHPILIGYLFWGLGFTGLHRFYFGKPLTGILWFFTGGLFLIGWIVDLFLIPSMADEANHRYRHGRIDHTVTWLLHLLLGFLGAHRFYMGKILTGVLYLCTGGLLGIGLIYDTLTLNEQVEEVNRRSW